MLPDRARRYLEKSGVKGPWTLSGFARGAFAGAVVIPSLAEGDSLFATLDSLRLNPDEFLEQFIVVIVINHGEDSTCKIALQNENDLVRLSDYARGTALNLAWIDAASPGCSLPRKQSGVGFARKLGLDSALTLLDWRSEPVLVCLDADTLVEENYLQTILEHFGRCEAGAAVVPYRHQPAGRAAQQAAIDRYELFLRSYVYGLRLAGSPYAFNSVGSAMACRASAYVRCGGMNTRKAGEDFYFLQKLAKTDGVERLIGTTVMPAPRISSRVPFGTGRSMERMLDDDYRGVLVYPVEVFRVLSDWLALVAGTSLKDADLILAAAAEISPVLSDYLDGLDWCRVWPAMQEVHQTEAALQQAFHVWFDGFRSMRLIHLLCEHNHERGEPEKLLPDYFAWGGCECPQTTAGMLEKLRLFDGG